MAQQLVVNEYVQQEINMLISSDPANGATNLSPDGSRFQVQLDDSLRIPADAREVVLKVEEATIWWTVPNIITGVNDTFQITGPSALNVPTVYTVILAQGLYDLSGMNIAILTSLQNQGAAISPSPLINMNPDTSTGRVLITFNYANTSINFGVANNFSSIVGFNPIVYGPYAPGFTLQAPNIANFNVVNSFLIHSDLVDNGIRINNKYDQIIANVLINVAPGSQILYEPQSPAKIPCNNLRGVRKTTLLFSLTDENLIPVNTGGEYWTVRLNISFKSPMLNYSR